MRYVVFHEHSGTIVGTVMCEGVDGLWFESEQAAATLDEKSEALGEFVRSLLARSREGVEKPLGHNSKRFDHEMFKAMGLETKAEFVAGARMAHVMEEEDGVLPFQPVRNLGGRKGWYANQNDDPPIVVVHGSDSDIGRALARALEHFGPP